MELSRAPSTAETYLRVARRFVEFCGKRDSSELTLGDVTEFVSRFPAATTRAKVCHALRRFLVFVGREDLARQMPFPRGVRMRLPQYVTEEEVRKGIESLKSPLDRALIAVAYWCGLRISEVALLRRDDVDLEKLSIRVKRVKGRGGAVEEHELPLTDWVAQELRRYLETRQDDDPRLFPLSREAVRRRFKRFAKAIGRPDLTFHSLRHGRGTDLARMGASTAEIAAWLHHRGQATSMLYVHLGAQELRKVIEKALGIKRSGTQEAPDQP